MDIRPVANLPQPAQAVPDKPVASAPLAVASAAAEVEPKAKLQQPSPVPSASELAQALKNINRLLENVMPPQDLEFSLDEESGRTIVKVLDQKTREVLRQIPSEEALELAKALELSPGLLIRQKA